METQLPLFAGPRRRRRLRLLGADALDLLHRLSASRLNDLAVGHSRAAVFTDDKGKVLDLALVVVREAEIELLPGRAQVLAEWIERFVFTEDVEIAVPEETATVEWLRGPVPAELDTLATPLELGTIALHGASGVEELEELAARLERGDAREFDESARRRWLFEQGILAPGDGLDGRLNALEAGLQAFVDFEKGCYVGQEVIARLTNYDKLKRSLALLRGDGAPPRPGDELRADSGALARVLEVEADDENGAVALLLADRSIDEGAILTGGHEHAGTLSWAPARGSLRRSG